jgi:hypothetical protein
VQGQIGHQEHLEHTWGTQQQQTEQWVKLTYADDTANEWYITGVQLEAGTTASDFEFLPVDVNLGRCRRYFQNYEYNSGTVICIANSHDTTQASGGFDINLPMRSAPTITLPPTGRSGATITFLTAASSYPTTDGTIAFTGLTNAGVSWLYNTSAVDILLDAEL